MTLLVMMTVPAFVSAFAAMGLAESCICKFFSSKHVVSP
jgi:hypothetical protein